MDQVSHQFDFSVLTVLNARKADTIHRRFFDLILDMARRATEYEAVDSIRVADDFCSYSGSTYKPDFTETIVRRQIELGRAIIEGGKYSVLHADGDLRRYLAALVEGYSGFHPLDIRPKSTVANAHDWAVELGAVRRSLPEVVFFTGIPVDLLCNRQVSVEEFVDVVRHVIDTVGQDRLILTTTHRPYPGWSFRDFEEKAYAIRRFLQSLSRYYA